jgi:putative ubiquitin-RnfH superfamily antitoxin RatB of RatAB toxin-antitoxin module
MAEQEMIPVEVAYALPEEQVILALEVPLGTTIRQTIELSGIVDRFSEIDVDEADVGVFGKAQTLETVLKPRDRVEIYRPITCDPKEVRRQRARKK